jgi:hypothetical protein
MGYVSLIKYIVITLLLCGLVSLIHNNGRKVERNKWLKEQSDYQQQLAKDFGEAMQRKAGIENTNNENVARVINEKDESLKKLEADIAANSSGMYVYAKGCGNKRTVPGKAEGASKPDSATDRIRLSDEDAENIQRDYLDAQRVVVQYETCRAALLPLVNVVE